MHTSFITPVAAQHIHIKYIKYSHKIVGPKIVKKCNTKTKT